MLKPSPLGHNGPPNIFDGTESLPKDLKRMTWFPLDIQALRKALFDKPLDQRGFYISALLAMYEYMEALPEDENKARLRMGGIDVRTYRKMRDLFIDYGFFHRRPSGRISNDRFEEEITKYIAEFRNRQTGWTKRDETIKQRADRGRSGKQRAEIADRSDRSPGDLRAKSSAENQNDPVDLSEKYNKINGGDVSIQPELSLNDGVSTGGDIQREKERKEEEPPKPPKGGDAIDEKFEQWWQAFPKSVRKVGKGECKDLFRHVTAGGTGRRGAKARSHGGASAGDLIEAARLYAATMPDPDFVPKPSTWLNEGRWMDDPAPPQPHKPTAGSSDKPAPPPYWWKGREDDIRKWPLDAWERAVSKHANGVWNEPMLGPPPGSADCIVSDEALRELRLLEQYDERGAKRMGGA